MTTTKETLRDELADEIAGHPIGSGYYSDSVGMDEARYIADTLLARFAVIPRSPYEVKESEFAPRCGRDGEGVVLRPGSTPEKLRNIAANFVALAEYLEAKELEAGEAA